MGTSASRLIRLGSYCRASTSSRRRPENGWRLSRRPDGKRPHAAGWRSVAEKPNQRRAADVMDVFCARDGWCHMTTTIDCCDRAIAGWRLSRTEVAQVAAAAPEDTLREREVEQGGLGSRASQRQCLVFGAKPFVAVVNR